MSTQTLPAPAALTTPSSSVTNQPPSIASLQRSVSPSRLALFQSCRLKFYFRHVLGLRKPNTPALHVGASVHLVLARWNKARWRQEDPSLSALYAEYEDAWVVGQQEATVAWEDSAHEADQKQVGWRLLETFFRETNLRTGDKPEAVEVMLEADLSHHGLPTLTGVLDLVQGRRVIDFKTSSVTTNAERAALMHGTQATAYALLYRENTGRREISVELHHLVKLKAPRLVVIALPGVGEREHSRLLRVIDSYVVGLERRDFVPAPGLQCASCEFANKCAAWPG